VQIPNERLKQARLTAEVLGDEVWNKFPFVQGARPAVIDKVEMILNRSWRPALSITGIDGLPALGSAGNVLRPFTACKISLRIPPRLDPVAATRVVKETLEKDPPYGARVVFDGDKSSTGWDAPPLAQWLSSAVDRASRNFFGKPPMAFGEGGTIPFMGMLGEKFPEAQFLITGVLGPGSNAHGPNEFLHVPTGVRLTACVASVVADHFAR
jgi:acetylornithine deacetylase/succinyl-diaminopimelate desuccinylase-like protein